MTLLAGLEVVGVAGWALLVVVAPLPVSSVVMSPPLVLGCAVASVVPAAGVGLVVPDEGPAPQLVTPRLLPGGLGWDVVCGIPFGCR